MQEVHMTNVPTFPYTNMDYNLLGLLARREIPATFQELADESGYSKKSVYHAIKKLIKRGLVSQAVSGSRGAVRSIAITDEGRNVSNMMDYLYEIVDQTGEQS